MLTHTIIMTRALYREAESHVSHHQTSKHQCTHLGLATNPNSPFSERWKLHIKFENSRRDIIYDVSSSIFKLWL